MMHGPVPSRRFVLVMGWGAMLIVVALVGFMWVTLANQDEQIGRQGDRLDATGKTQAELQADLLNQKAASEALAAQVRRLGGKPVVTPPQVTIPGATGIQGPPGPTGPQGATGPKGDPGRNGANGTAGTTGGTGSTGPSGTPGAKGDPGPKGDTGDQGPKGDTGPTGDPGPAGYPVAFAFAVPQLVGGPIVYTCTDLDGDHAYDCQPNP